MSKLLAWFLTTKVGRGLAAATALLAAVAGVALAAWLKGRKQQRGIDEAKATRLEIKAVQEAAEYTQRSADAVRQTHEDVAKMPDAGTQRVGDAAPGTAADWLRQHANRDQADP